MQIVTYQMLHEAHPRHIIIDPMGEHCKGCGAPLRVALA